MLRHSALRLFHGEHLHECKTLRALVVFVRHNFCVLDGANAIEKLEQVTLGRFERQVSHVKTRGRDFD